MSKRARGTCTAIVLTALATCSSAVPSKAAESESTAAESSRGAAAQTCKVNCIDPHPCCPESEKVIEVLKKLTTAYAHGDIKTYEEYLDDNCTTFNESKKTLVTGKENVLAELRRKFVDFAPGGSKPLKSFTIDLPYAKLSPDGSTCTVTFVAIREIGGAHPMTEESHITDVFVKRGDNWKKLHYRGAWKKVASK